MAGSSPNSSFLSVQTAEAVVMAQGTEFQSPSWELIVLASVFHPGLVCYCKLADGNSFPSLCLSSKNLKFWVFKNLFVLFFAF